MPAVPESSAGSVKGDGTASTVTHVKAGITDSSQAGLVLHAYGYSSARESPDGAGHRNC
jgi:hypothetical protein